MIANAQAAFDALGDPTRRRVFELVAERPRSVSEVAMALPVSRPAVSQHLRVLKDAYLVVDRAEGTRRVYAVDRRGVDAIRRYLDRFWDDALERFREAAERAAAGRPALEGDFVAETHARKTKRTATSTSEPTSAPTSKQRTRATAPATASAPKRRRPK